jgi:hypothetical protein
MFRWHCPSKALKYIIITGELNVYLIFYLSLLEEAVFVLYVVFDGGAGGGVAFAVPVDADGDLAGHQFELEGRLLHRQRVEAQVFDETRDKKVST